MVINQLHFSTNNRIVRLISITWFQRWSAYWKENAEWEYLHVLILLLSVVQQIVKGQWRR